MFYRLLSVSFYCPATLIICNVIPDPLQWKNPRATAISFAVCVVFIFASRYLNIIRYMFKALYIVLGGMFTQALNARHG